METEFLSMIYEGKVEPSITEMGLTIRDISRKWKNTRRRKTESTSTRSMSI